MRLFNNREIYGICLNVTIDVKIDALKDKINRVFSR